MPTAGTSTLNLSVTDSAINCSRAPLLPNPTLLYCLHWNLCSEEDMVALFPSARRSSFSSSGPATLQTFLRTPDVVSAWGWAGVPHGHAPQHPYWIQTLHTYVCLLACCISCCIRKIQFVYLTTAQRFPTAHTEHFLPSNTPATKWERIFLHSKQDFLCELARGSAPIQLWQST